MSKAQLPGSILTLSCMLTLSLVKLLNTLTKDHLKTTHKMFLLLTLTPDQNYHLSTQPITKDSPQIFQPTQVQTAISPNTFLPKMQVFIPKKKSDVFGMFQRFFFFKHSDTTLQLIGKAIRFEFMSKQSEFLPNNPNESHRIGLHEYMLNLTSLSYT